MDFKKWMIFKGFVFLLILVAMANWVDAYLLPVLIFLLGVSTLIFIQIADPELLEDIGIFLILTFFIMIGVMIDLTVLLAIGMVIFLLYCFDVEISSAIMIFLIFLLFAGSMVFLPSNRGFTVLESGNTMTIVEGHYRLRKPWDRIHTVGPKHNREEIEVELNGRSVLLVVGIRIEPKMTKKEDLFDFLVDLEIDIEDWKKEVTRISVKAIKSTVTQKEIRDSYHFDLTQIKANDLDQRYKEKLELLGFKFKDTIVYGEPKIIKAGG